MSPIVFLPTQAPFSPVSTPVFVNGALGAGPFFEQVNLNASSVPAGELMIVVTGWRVQNPSDVNEIGTSVWTKVVQDIYGAGSTKLITTVWAKISSGSEPTNYRWDVTQTGGGGDRIGTLNRFPVHNVGDPSTHITTTSALTGASSTPTLPGITYTANGRVLSLLSVNQSALGIVGLPPTGYTQFSTVFGVPKATSNFLNRSEMYLNDQSGGTVSPNTDITFVQPSPEWLAQTIAIR